MIDLNYYKQERIGDIVLMSPRPSLNHMKIEFYLSRKLDDYFSNSVCNVIIETSLFLTNRGINTNDSREVLKFIRESSNEVIPDIMVYCNKSQECTRGIIGIPKIVIEILSSNRDDDLITKFNLYEKYGIQEYWIVDPLNKEVYVYFYNQEKYKYEDEIIYTFNEVISSKLFKDLRISLKDLDLVE